MRSDGRVVMGWYFIISSKETQPHAVETVSKVDWSGWEGGRGVDEGDRVGREEGRRCGEIGGERGSRERRVRGARHRTRVLVWSSIPQARGGVLLLLQTISDPKPFSVRALCIKGQR